MIIWLKSLQIFSAQDGLIDFLSVCFAINTMFSFSRLQRRLSFWIQNGMQKELNEINPIATDCSCKLKSCGLDEDAVNTKCLKGIIGYKDEFIQKKSFVCKCVKNWLLGAKFVFCFFAVLCVVGILFSREPILVQHPFWVAMGGLGPVVVFFITYGLVGLWILCRIFPWCKKKKNDTVASFKNIQNIVDQVTAAIEKKQK